MFRSIQAAIEILEAMDDFKPYLEKAYGKVFDIGIGIHHGEVIVGTVGSGKDQRINIIGDTVNTASRIEAANKDADTRLLISEDCYELVKDRVEVEDFIRQKLRVRARKLHFTKLPPRLGRRRQRSMTIFGFIRAENGIKHCQFRTWLTVKKRNSRTINLIFS